jgi:hypothetical protein
MGKAQGWGHFQNEGLDSTMGCPKALGLGVPEGPTLGLYLTLRMWLINDPASYGQVGQTKCNLLYTLHLILFVVPMNKASFLKSSAHKSKLTQTGNFRIP